MSERLIVNLMKHTRLLSQAGVACTDAALVERFVASRDESAFTTLVRRHGPMVWAVCRNALPTEADAEDAFQATFLALVRSAPRIHRGAAVGAWLHSAAVRICLVQRRSKKRRTSREAKVARADLTLSPTVTLSDELALAHEAIGALPRREHEVFVLCVLEGIPQAEAARRLGLKLNSVSGLLARAAKRLRSQLSSSGTLSVGALAIAASCPAAVPAHLFTQAARLGGPSTAFPSSILVLSTCVMESAMRKAIMIALVTMTLGLGVTAGRWFLATAEAQHAPPQQNAFDTFRGQQSGTQTVQGYSVPLHTPWEYKVLTSEAHQSNEARLNSLGSAGWELTSTTVVPNSSQLMFVFKRSRTSASKSSTEVTGRIFEQDARKTNEARLTEGGRYTETFSSVNKILLKHTSATDMAEIIKDVFKNGRVSVDTRTNALLLQGNNKDISEIKELIEKLDTLHAKPEKSLPK